MYYCGIDIAKTKHVIALIDETGTILKQGVSINNDLPGFERLDQLLLPYKGDVRIGLEATGHYWLALYEHFSKLGYELNVINPLLVKAFRKVDIRKRKTDRIDSVAISQFLRIYKPSSTQMHLPVILQLKELTRFRFQMVQNIGDCKRKIISVLDRVFPEYEQLFSDVFLITSRQLLSQAVTAEEFAAFDLTELEQLLQSVSRKRFGAEKAAQIHSAACQSVGVSFLTDAIHIEMHCMLQQIELLEEQCAEVEDKIKELMNSIPHHITTISGIGLVTGGMLLAEIGDIQRFPKPENLVAYAGIDPTVYKTGQFEGDEMHMSKRGSHYLRWAIWQAAGSSLLHNPELRQYYDKKRAEGKTHGVAMGALCNKLLGRIYVVMKEQRPYVNR
jgi:transposase